MRACACVCALLIAAIGAAAPLPNNGAAQEEPLPSVSSAAADGGGGAGGGGGGGASLSGLTLQPPSGAWRWLRWAGTQPCPFLPRAQLAPAVAARLARDFAARGAAAAELTRAVRRWAEADDGAPPGAGAGAGASRDGRPLLLTLTGPTGTGKTATALALAAAVSAGGGGGGAGGGGESSVSGMSAGAGDSPLYILNGGDLLGDAREAAALARHHVANALWQCRGAAVVVIDEAQKAAPGALAVLADVMQHGTLRWAERNRDGVLVTTVLDAARAIFIVITDVGEDDLYEWMYRTAAAAAAVEASAVPGERAWARLRLRLDWELRQNLTSLAARYGADLGAHSAAVVPFLPYRQVDAEQMHAVWLMREQARAAAAALRAAAAARTELPPPGALMLRIDVGLVAALLTDPAYVRYSWDQERYSAVLAAVRQQPLRAEMHGMAVAADGEAALSAGDAPPAAAAVDAHVGLRRRVPEYAIERGARQIEPRLSESPVARLQDILAEVTAALTFDLELPSPAGTTAPCGASIAAVAARYNARPAQLADILLAHTPAGDEVEFADAGRLLAGLWRRAAATLTGSALAPEARLARALARAAARGAAWPPLRTLAVDALPCDAAACSATGEPPGRLRIRLCALTPRLASQECDGGAEPAPAIDEVCVLKPLFFGSLV